MLTPFDYANMGYHMVPWLNRRASERKPLIKGWVENTPSPETVQKWMTQWPDADWAIVPHVCMVVDCDVKNGKDGLKWFRDRAHEEKTELSLCAISETYSKGRHYWFRMPPGFTKYGQVSIADGVEIKYRNSSAHVPPSDGYTWLQPLGLPSELPVAPDWLLSVWQLAKDRPGESHDYEKPTYVNGQRRMMLCSMAGALRNLSLNETELNAALRAIRDTRCEKGDDPFTDEEVAGIAKDFAKKSATDYVGLVLAGDPLARSVEAFVSPVTTVSDVDTEEEDEPTKEVDGMILPDRLLYPTPLIEEWVKYTDGTNPRHQPELALMGCLTALGSIMGRRWTWERSKGNLYSLGLGGSGQGKDRTWEAIPEIFAAAGFEDLIGAAELGSDSGMIEELTLKPEVIWIHDEMSKMIQALNMPSCPKYFKDVEKLLTILYTGNTYYGKKLKGQETKALENPYPCFYGLAQPKTFWRNYNVGMTDSGFLGRFIIFNGRPHPPIDTLAAKRHKCPPKSLIDMLLAAKTVFHEELSRLQNLTGGLQDIDGDAAMHDYSDTIVHRCDDIAQEAFKRGDSVIGTLYSRNTEKVKRLALIHAYSLEPTAPKMTKASLDWAFEILDHANQCLIHGMRNTVAPNIQSEHMERVVNVLKQGKDKGITASVLIRSTTNLKKVERVAIMDDLTEAGTVRKVITKPKSDKGGRPTITYYLTEYAPYDLGEAMKA